MENKGFADSTSTVNTKSTSTVNMETPNHVSNAEKPLKMKPNRPNRVDINVLKSKLQESESKEFKKNLYILSSLVLGLGILGIYLSL